MPETGAVDDAVTQQTVAVDPSYSSLAQERPEAEPRPWLLAAIGLVLILLPTVVVLAGPLQSNGSPARLLGYLAAGLLGLQFVHITRSRDGRIRRADVGVIVIVVYAVSQLPILAVSWSRPVNELQNAAILRSALGIVVTSALAISIITQCRTARSRRFVIGAIIAGASYAAVVGLLQGVSTVNLQYLLKPPGFTLLVERTLENRDGFTRVVGTSDHPIEFSVMVAATLPLAVHFARFGKSRRVRLWSGVSAALLLASVPASVSRTAVVTLLASLTIYMFALKLRMIVNAMILLAGVLVVFYFTATQLFDTVIRLFTEAGEDTSISARTDDYAYVGAIFDANPWLGLGFGAAQPSETRYLDNEWLGQIIAGGVLGVTALAFLFVAGLAALAIALHRAKTRSERDLVFALGAAYVALLVSTTVFDMFTFQQAYFMLFIVIGMLMAMAQSPDGADPTVTTGPSYPLIDAPSSGASRSDAHTVPIDPAEVKRWLAR